MVSAIRPASQWFIPSSESHTLSRVIICLDYRTTTTNRYEEGQRLALTHLLNVGKGQEEMGASSAVSLWQEETSWT